MGRRPGTFVPARMKKKNIYKKDYHLSKIHYIQ